MVVKCSDFVNHSSTVVEYARENSVVNFITSFEVYLLEISSRIIYLDTDLIKEDKAQISIVDIAKGLKNNNYKYWFSNKVADKWIRGKQHHEIIKKIADLAKCDIKSIQAKIDSWEKWTYVRNSIVHAGRRISQDLHDNWPERFKNQGGKLDINDNELMSLQALAMDIVKHLDKKISDNIIKEKDAIVLIRELFVRSGIDNVSVLKTILYENLSFKVKGDLVEKTLATQRRTSAAVDELDFDSFISSINIKMKSAP